MLSPATEAIDRREKFLNYRTIPTLGEYVVVAQDRPEVVIHRRQQNWQAVSLVEPSAIAEFESLKINLPLSEIYEGL